MQSKLTLQITNEALIDFYSKKILELLKKLENKNRKKSIKKEFDKNVKIFIKLHKMIKV